MNYYEYYLMYFKYLYDQGIINKDMYENLKEQILNQMNGNNHNNQKPREELVYITSLWNEKNISVEGEKSYIKAIKDNVGLSERFNMITIKNGKVILQADSGYYVRIIDDFLVADAVDRKDAEKFKIEYRDDEATFKASNGYYIRVRERDLRLVARAENQGKKTRFKINEIKEIEYSDVLIKSVSEQRYVKASMGGESVLIADGNEEGKNSMFNIIEFKNGKISIKTRDGYYVRVREDNQILWADVSEIEKAEKFKVIEHENDEVSLKASNGYYVRVRDKDKWLVAKAENTGRKTRLQIFI